MTGAGTVSTVAPFPSVMTTVPVIPVATVAPLVLITGPTPTTTLTPTPTALMSLTLTPAKQSSYLDSAKQVISHECGLLGERNMLSACSNCLPRNDGSTILQNSGASLPRWRASDLHVNVYCCKKLKMFLL